MQQAIAAIHSGLHRMAEEDGELSLDIAADLPDEVAALEDAMRGIVRGIQDAAAMADAAVAQAKALDARSARFHAREQRLRGVLMAGLDAMGWAKKIWPEATVSLRPGGAAVLITDEGALPPQFVQTRTTTTPLRKEIAAALKAGEEVSGATLTNGVPVLSIHTK